MVVRSLCSAESEWEATIKGTEVPKVMSPANQGRRKGGNPGFFSLSISEKKDVLFPSLGILIHHGQPLSASLFTSP